MANRFDDNKMFRIAQGLEPDKQILSKNGVNPDISTTSDPEDVWDNGGIYIWSTTADINRLSSSNDNDTVTITVIVWLP